MECESYGWLKRCALLGDNNSPFMSILPDDDIQWIIFQFLDGKVKKQVISDTLNSFYGAVDSYAQNSFFCTSFSRALVDKKNQFKSEKKAAKAIKIIKEALSKKSSIIYHNKDGFYFKDPSWKYTRIILYLFFVLLIYSVPVANMLSICFYPHRTGVNLHDPFWISGVGCFFSAILLLLFAAYHYKTSGACLKKFSEPSLKLSVDQGYSLQVCLGGFGFILLMGGLEALLYTSNLNVNKLPFLIVTSVGVSFICIACFLCYVQIRYHKNDNKNENVSTETSSSRTI